MGKAQSKLKKAETEDSGRKRRNAKSRNSKALRWLSKRFIKTTNSLAREEDFQTAKSNDDVNKCSIIKNQGCSHWDEEMLKARHAGIRTMQPQGKNQNLGALAIYSKVNAIVSIEELVMNHKKVECIQIENDCSEAGHANEEADLNRENDITYDIMNGLFSHLSYFSPKVTMESQLTLAQTDDLLEPPMIEVVTDEKDQYIIASILINFTLVKQYAVQCLTQMNSVRMCQLLQQQCNLWHKDRYLVWSDFFIKVSKDSYHRFVTTQFLLKKKVDGAQCSFANAKKERWC